MKSLLISAVGLGTCLVFNHELYAETQPGLADMTRTVAAESIVLLKNDEQILPLTPDRRVSIFGRIQIDYFACGYGSGGDVKTPYTINILEAMRRHPGITVNAALANQYEAWCANYPPDNGSWGNWPLNHPEMPLESSVVAQAALGSDLAVVIIGRAAGEDREAQLEAGSYYLTATEKKMLAMVDKHFEQMVVIVNSGNIIDMSWVQDYAHIHSVLLAWQGGMQGGVAIADVLSGDVSPSGRLTATIAKRYADYPTSGESGGEKVFAGQDFSNYVEDIYVGYRYFETFAKEKVYYPFGYGLGYSNFEIQTMRVQQVDGSISVEVAVKNVGNTYSGKEVIQVYYGAPQGQLGKASKSLIAYAKTKTLAPGESESIRLSFNIEDMASYDDAGKTGHKSAYVLEAGEYPLYVGASVRDAVRVGAYMQHELRITQQLTEVSAVPVGNGFQRLKVVRNKEGVLTAGLEEVPVRTASLSEVIEKSRPHEIRQTHNSGITLLDVHEGRAGMDAFVAQLSVDELDALCRGDFNMSSRLGAPGNAAVYGGVTEALREKGVVPVTTVDGPSGVRLTASASLLPIGTALASTWNDTLIEELCGLVGCEMILNRADVLLSPGMNIQRDPLGGRNFEYFSEDPLLTGQMGVNVIRGLQSQGIAATPKHFGLNNQETRRRHHDSRCSERAIREIYAKAFEICVKTAQPQNIMASYNKINGVYSHYNYDLFTTMLRDEWGYDGVVMTDWWIQRGVKPGNGHIYDNAYRVEAQVDVLMPGSGPGDGERDRSLINSYHADNGITLGEMQRSARNVLNVVMKSTAFRHANNLGKYDYEIEAGWFEVEQQQVSMPRLTALSLDGELLKGFNPLITDYHIYRPAGTELPVCRVDAPGCEVSISRATEASPVSTVRVSNKHAHSLYRVYFSDSAGLEPVVENPVYARITNLYIDGEELPQFYPGELEYRVSGVDIGKIRITADVPEGVTCKVVKNADRNRVTVRAESLHQAMEYQVYIVQTPDHNVAKNKKISIAHDASTRVEAEDYIFKTSPINTQACEDIGGGLNIGWAACDNYLLYAIHVTKSGQYEIRPRIASDVGALTQLSYNLEIDGDVVTSYVHGGTGGWQNWQSMEPKGMYLEEGNHKLRLHFITADINVNYLDIRYIGSEKPGLLQ